MPGRHEDWPQLQSWSENLLISWLHQEAEAAGALEMVSMTTAATHSHLGCKLVTILLVCRISRGQILPWKGKGWWGGGTGESFQRLHTPKRFPNSKVGPRRVNGVPCPHLSGLSAGLGWVNQPVRGDEGIQRPEAPAVCPVLSGPAWPPLGSLSTSPLVREGG